MASLAHKFAFESPQVTTEVISVVAWPEFAWVYQVAATPYTVLDGVVYLSGRVQEEQLRAAVQARFKRS